MSIPQKIAGWMIALSAVITAVFWLSAMAEEGQFGTPKGTEGSRIFKATEHPYYSGEFRFKGERTTLIGSMRDTSPWDHLDYAGKRLLACDFFRLLPRIRLLARRSCRLPFVPIAASLSIAP